MTEGTNREKDTIKEQNTIGMMQEIYRCAKMGSDSALDLMKSVKSDEQKSDFTAMLNGYQKIATNSAEQLRNMGADPKEESMMTKMGAKLGMKMNTMMDSTPSHIAEMAIQGANMGITDLQSLLNRYDNESCFDEARRMAEGSIRFNEKVIEDMKKYLG